MNKLKSFRIKKAKKLLHYLKKSYEKIPFHEKIEEKAFEILVGLVFGFIG